jgi:DNA polymerase III delta subunit
VRSPARSGARDALKAIAAGKLEPVYLLLGDDDLAAGAVLRRLREAAVEPGFEPFDYELMHADELDPVEACQHMRQAPMGPRRRLVVVREITRQGRDGPVFPKIGKAGVEKLLEAMAELAAGPARDSVTVAATGPAKKELAALVRKLKLGGYVVKVEGPGAGDMVAVVTGWAKRLGLALAPDAARLLVETSGADSTTLRSEVQKLATCFGKGERITADAVRDLAGASREFTLREYVDAALSRDVPAALGVLRRLESLGEEPHKLVAWLSGGLLDLVAARAGVLPGNMRWRVRGRIDRWPNTGELNRCLQQLYRIDLALLTGKPEPWARFEVFTQCLACPGRKDYCEVYADGGKHELCMYPPRRRKNG